jgi:pSer/pThr/pTyr-binding forkhead associated (FHA) protein
MASIIILTGPTRGARFLLSKEQTTLGRSPECDIPIPDPHLARQHVRFIQADGECYAEDMGSFGGFIVNDERVAGRILLRDKDCIRIADFRAVFERSE